VVFQNQTYNVLLVSASKKLNATVLPLLPETDFWPVDIAGSINEAYRRMIGISYDLIIINAPLPDELGVEFAIEASKNDDSCVLLLIGSDIYEETYFRLLPHGVITLSKPTNVQSIAHNLRVLCAMRERLRRMKKKQATVEEKMEEIRLVNRAKWLLINHKNMTEPTAHQYIIQQAMDRRMSKKALAEEIIKTYDPQP